MARNPRRDDAQLSADIRARTFETGPNGDGWITSGTWIEENSAIRFTSFNIRNADPDSRREITWDVLRSSIQMRSFRDQIYSHMRDYFEDAIKEGKKLTEYLQEKHEGAVAQQEVMAQIVAQWTAIRDLVEEVKPSKGGRPRTKPETLRRWAVDLLDAVRKNPATFRADLAERWAKEDRSPLSPSTVRHRIARLKREGLITGNAPDYTPTDRLSTQTEGD